MRDEGEKNQKKPPQTFRPTTTARCRELQNGTFLRLALFFFFWGKHMVISIFLVPLWCAYFFPAGNLNVLLISLYTHIIRKQTKKCFDWTCAQDTTGSNLPSCPWSQDWWVSVTYFPLCSQGSCGQLLNKNTQWGLWARTSSQFTSHCSHG